MISNARYVRDSISIMSAIFLIALALVVDQKNKEISELQGHLNDSFELHFDVAEMLNAVDLCGPDGEMMSERVRHYQGVAFFMAGKPDLLAYKPSDDDQLSEGE